MDQPFDARRAMLLDAPLPHERWRPVSLVCGLRGAVMQDPGCGAQGEDQRLVALNAIVMELTRRGLDGESLVRYGLAPEVAISLVGLLMPDLPALETEAPMAGHDVGCVAGERAAAWKKVLAPLLSRPLDGRWGLNDAPENTWELIMTLGVLAVPWILSAPLSDLVALTPPESLPPASGSSAPQVTVELFEEYRWTVERFSITHLTDWQTSSLHRELRWMSGRHPAPCPDQLMRDRDVPLAELQAEIAHRAVSPPRREESFVADAMTGTLATRMQIHATQLLRDRRFAEAAALFEFAVAQHPDDATAANNLGFCLVPLAPARAIRYLTQASDSDYAFPLINAYNRAVAHQMLGEYRSALSVIEQAWRAATSGPVLPATLWGVQPSGELVLLEGASIREQMAVLAVFAATQLGDRSAVSRWREHCTDV